MYEYFENIKIRRSDRQYSFATGLFFFLIELLLSDSYEIIEVGSLLTIDNILLNLS